MAKNKKFGTFAGVFTPSLLTILGVIMYMRLSWVVGEAGLIGAIAIIVIAHIISITTGLSISSIATDKKIKAGGIYYILSRSLGLPMGGAIGIALFIGTALSISLYIIGFAENFLSIPQISEFLNLAPGINSYRIVGTGIVIILVIMAFISTSLAIKTQYFILAAVGLSIVSIFMGFNMHPEFIPEQPVFFKADDAISIEMVFAIFFPAVTGFTAGVAMSGDLLNPKKNIPIGTLLAIAVGFVVYIALAVGFAFFIDRSSLINDTNVVMKVAWIPALVIAGIWGATLSSALGGILGGPRILQALSQDSIMPKIFGKGYGATNEPRTALIAIFVIAEAGIMIGSLDVIAGVVTMFYLTTYGVINLAYVLENWASTDFRPSFKVSKIFGIVGFIFAFAIMFKLDVVSMLVAFLLIGLVYFILQRKQLKLDFGDVWQSVWISIIRKGLHVLDNNNIEDRNWQPNILLFSGATEKRPHLLEFGKSLVGKFGLLSNFDLTVDTETDVLFPKHKQSIPIKKTPEVGIFTRRQSCKDIYDGIEMIVRTYGFSGIEPNTIVQGWGRQSKNPERFVKLIKTINDLDYNILLVDYDKRFGYGKYEQIDIWWRGAGNNGNFALTLAKFMHSSQKWENAKIRLLIVNNEDSKAFYIYRQANEILKAMRIEGEVKIVNNEVEQMPFYDIIRVESKSADIVFIGIPGIKPGTEHEFVDRTNVLLRKIGTVVLLKASSLFKDMNLGVNLMQQSVISTTNNIDIIEEISNDLVDSKQDSLNNQMRNSFEGIVTLYDKTIETYTYKEIDDFLIFLKQFKVFFDDVFTVLTTNLTKLPKEKRANYIAKYENASIKKVNKEIENFKQNYLDDLKEIMLDVQLDYNLQKMDFLNKIETDIYLKFDRKEFKIRKKDKLKYRFFKLHHRGSTLNNQDIKIKYSAKSRTNTILPSLFEVLFREIEQIRIETIRFIFHYEEIIKKIVNSLNKLKGDISDIELLTKNINIAKENYEKNYKNLEIETKNIVIKVAKNRKKILLKGLNSFLKNANTLDTFFEFRNKKITSKVSKGFQETIETKNETLFTSFELFLNYIQVKNEITALNFNVIDEINLLSQKIIDVTKAICDKYNLAINQKNTPNNDLVISQSVVEFEIDEAVKLTISRILDSISNLPKSINIMEQNSLNDSFYKNFNDIKTITIPLSQAIDLLVKDVVIDTVEKSVYSLKEKLKENIEILNNRISAKNKESHKIQLSNIQNITDIFEEEVKELNSEISMIKLHKIIDKIAKRKRI